jgi:signal transduction histidine kinase
MEEAVAKQNEELQQLTERLKELDNLKNQLFANVSHELRTPYVVNMLSFISSSFIQLHNRLALILGPTEKMLAGLSCA